MRPLQGARNHVMNKPAHDNFSHAVEALELPSVLGWVARKTVNEGAGRRVTELWPTTDEALIRHSLDEIDVVRRYEEAEGRLPIVDVADAKRYDFLRLWEPAADGHGLRAPLR